MPKYTIVVDEWRCLTFTGTVEAETEAEAKKIALSWYTDFTNDVTAIDPPEITSIAEAQGTREAQ